jgi:hypothetical protein
MVGTKSRMQDWLPRIGQRLAVLIPCFNEETAIAKVVGDFRAALPEGFDLRLR